MSEKRFKTIVMSLGELVEVETDLCQIENHLAFGAEVSIKTQASPDYFQWRELKLYHNGKCEDINVRNCIFSCIVKIECYDHCYKGSNTILTINGLGCDGSKFSVNLPRLGDFGDLINVVFAMIVISACVNIEEAKHVWNLLSSINKTKSIEECLMEIRTIKNKGSKIISDYQFMNNIFDKRIQERVQWIIEKIKLESKIN